MAALENFLIKSLKNVVVRNIATGEFMGTIDFADDITIDSSSTESKYTSGEGMSTLYSFYSEFTSDLSGNFVASVDLMKMILGVDDITPRTQLFSKTETLHVGGTAGEFTLKNTPKTGVDPDVFELDKNGKRTKLIKASGSTPAKGSYVVADKKIKTDASVTDIKVIYKYENLGIAFDKMSTVAAPVALEGECLVIDLGDKAEKTANIIIPAFQISPNFSLVVSNSDLGKFACTGSCLKDSLTGKSWSVIVEA